MLGFFSKNEYAEIANSFRLGKIRRMRYFRKGFQTPKVVAVTPQDEFVISKHRLSDPKFIVNKSRRSLAYEIELLNALGNLPIPHHVPIRKGEYILDYKGFGVTAYRFLHGGQPKRITEAMAFQIGKFVGEFHRRGRLFKKKLPGRREFYNITPQVVRRMMPYAKRQTHPLLKSVVKEVEQGVVLNRLSHQLPHGPIHVDIKPENELFERDKLTGVVDFGNFYIGPFILDVGKTIMWNCVRDKRLNLRLVRRFLNGYESRRKLTLEERRNLKRGILFAIYSHVFVDLYHVPLKYVPESYTLYLVKTFLPVVRWLEKQKNIL